VMTEAAPLGGNVPPDPRIEGIFTP
jgi:hypothetical protein